MDSVWLSKWTPAIETLHTGHLQVAIASAGGGMPAVAALQSVPGCSRTLLQAISTYASESLDRWLGHPPDQYCSGETALAMSARCFHESLELKSAKPEQLVGLGVTASLASDRPKRGAHRAYVATHSLTRTRLVELILEKDARTRAAEDRAVSELVLSELMRAAGLSSPELELLSERDLFQDWQAEPTASLSRLVNGEAPLAVAADTADSAERLAANAAGLMSGSFNPLHAGHRQLHAAAEAALGGPVLYELPIRNADKPPLDWLTIKRRCDQAFDAPLLLSQAPTFVEKAAVFPNTVFVVGADTAVRILDARFYSRIEGGREAAFAELAAKECSFLVAGREQDGRFIRLSDLAVPAAWSNLFRELPEFRRDCSSTELRALRGDAFGSAGPADLEEGG